MSNSSKHKMANPALALIVGGGMLIAATVPNMAWMLALALWMVFAITLLGLLVLGLVNAALSFVDSTGGNDKIKEMAQKFAMKQATRPLSYNFMDWIIRITIVAALVFAYTLGYFITVGIVGTTWLLCVYLAYRVRHNIMKKLAE